MNKKQSRTIIAAIKNRKGKIIMAGDRRVSLDWGSSYLCPYPKIKKLTNGILIGASGDSGLCKLCIDGFNQEYEIQTDPDTYMYHWFIPDLVKLLKRQPGFVDEHKLLRLAVGEACTILIACLGRLYTIDISNPEEDVKEYSMARVVLDDAPLPFAIGCGADSALPLLNKQYDINGYNTKEDLENAVQYACKVSPGCAPNRDQTIDFIQE